MPPQIQDRWYSEKLGLQPEQRRIVVQHYIEGLHWVLEYYYRGVASWNWFYPHHHAPMASDMRDLGEIKGQGLGECGLVRAWVRVIPQRSESQMCGLVRIWVLVIPQWSGSWACGLQRTCVLVSKHDIAHHRTMFCWDTKEATIGEFGAGGIMHQPHTTLQPFQHSEASITHL